MNTNADVTELTMLKSEMHCGPRWDFFLSGNINYAKIQNIIIKGTAFKRLYPFVIDLWKMQPPLKKCNRKQRNEPPPGGCIPFAAVSLKKTFYD